MVLPKEIHSPQPDPHEQLQRLKDDKAKKLQEDCKRLSATIAGQASHIKDQDRRICELTQQLDALKADLQLKVQQADDLQVQLESRASAEPVVEIKEVVKYVEHPNCDACEQLNEQLASMQAVEAQMREQIS